VKEKRDIPKGWKYLNLKKLITQDIKNGYSPNCPEEPNGSWILSLGNLTENGFDPSQVKPAPKDDMRVQDFLLEPGDFLISRSNTLDKVGRTMLFRGEIVNCSYPDLLMRFRVDETQVTNEYLEGYLRSSIVRTYIQRCASGTSGSMVKINKTSVEKIPVILPPLPEQKVIADLLSTWDEAIEKTERLIQAKEKWLKGLLRELIAEPQNTRKDTECKKVKLGDLFRKEIKVEKGKVVAKGSNFDGNIPVVAGGQTYAYFTSCLSHDIPTVTISASGAYAGFVWYHDYPIWASDCNVLYATAGVTKFLYFTLKAIQHRIYALQSGGAQPHVYSKDLKNILVIWPSPEDQQQIADTLSFVQHEIDLLKQLAEKYKTQKRGLMQKMLTGEWRVKPEVVKSYE
jgi:type I restriction enzyme, S subunit